LSLYIVQFVCSINVLSKFNYFERTLIRKNKKNKKNLKEQNSKEKNEFLKERYLIKQPRAKQKLVYYVINFKILAKSKKK
jgi:hypothetical protein